MRRIREGRAILDLKFGLDRSRVDPVCVYCSSKDVERYGARTVNMWR